MQLRALVLSSLVIPGVAHAGGLFLPGSGAISTSRAGAAVASADDGEALSVNPAGLAKTHGTTITISAAVISYAMQFTRRGTYDNLEMEDPPYEGQPFPTVKNDAKPSLGFGSFQPVPVVAIVSDLGGRVKNLHVAAGLYAPNAYPFRDMSNGYVFNGDFNAAPRRAGTTSSRRTRRSSCRRSPRRIGSSRSSTSVGGSRSGSATSTR